jgi:hypothetical protein
MTNFDGWKRVAPFSSLKHVESYQTIKIPSSILDFGRRAGREGHMAYRVPKRNRTL